MSSRRAAPTFALRFLGGASVLAADGTPLGGPVAHRRRLALLALLVRAHPAGVRRDKLVGLLWPERDEAAARNLLRVALHELRRSLGTEALFPAGEELRVEPRLLRSDVHAFEEALDAGDLRGAVARYGGPFLDGFFLDDAEAFGAWVDGERQRLETRHEDALRALAEQGGAAGDAAEAARWWRQLALRRPSDGQVARRLVDALAAAGDVGGALDHADAHAAYLRAEYGVAPDAGLAARVAALRRAAARPAARSEPAATTTTEVAIAPPPPEDRATVPAEPVTAPVTTPARRRWPRWGVAIGGGALAAAAALLALRPGRPAGAALHESVAVLPFTVVAGAPPELAEGLPTLLAVNLDQVGEIRVVPSQVVLAHAAAGGARGAEPARLARALRADVVLTGIVAPSREGIIVRAALVAADGQELARTEARGAAGDLTGIVDQLSVGALREIWGRRWGVPAPRLAAVGTSSPEALRAFVRGEAFLRAAQWDSAVPALAEAVDHDSTFALAHLRLAEAHGWRSGMGAPADARALATAVALADRLPPRERRLLTVRRLHESADLVAVDSAEAFAERYPDDPEAQYVRADTRFHARSVSGDSVARLAVAAFDTAAAIDPAAARVWTHALTLAFERGDLPRFDRAVAGLEAVERGQGRRGAGGGGAPSRGPDHALLRRIRWAAPAEAHRAFMAAVRAPTPPAPGDLEELVQALEMACLGAASPAPDLVLDGLAAVRARYPDATNPRVVGTLEGRRTFLLVGLGRLDAARARMDALWQSDPDGAARMVALPVAFGYAGRGWIDAHAAGLERSAFWSRTPFDRRKGEYWRGVFALQRGDVAAARAAFARAAAGGTASPPAVDPRDDRGMAALLRGVEGWARLVAGDTTAAMRMLAEGIRLGGYTDPAVGLGQVQRAVYLRLLAARPERRAQALDRVRGALAQRPTYLRASYQRLLAELLAAAGDAAGAAAARAAYAALWAGADAP